MISAWAVPSGMALLFWRYMSHKYIDLTGQKFGRLTVIRKAEKKAGSESRSAFWQCTCECGNTTVVVAPSLRSGNTQSCGCWNRDSHTKHGLSATYFNDAYDHAKRRCTKPSHKAFKHYGGRGIEFRFTNLEQFATELGERPSPKHSIDRINNDGHYEPGNVKWSNASEQAMNQRKRTPARMAHLRKAGAIRWSRHFSMVERLAA
jgi:hypothetical protein